MVDWSDVKKGITSLSDSEKEYLSFMAELIGEIVKRRSELNLSQRDLAELTGLPQPSIARFETLDVVPRIDTIFKIIKPLGLELVVNRIVKG